MNKCPQNPDAEVKKALREAYVKDSMPKHCNFLSKKVSQFTLACIHEAEDLRRRVKPSSLSRW